MLAAEIQTSVAHLVKLFTINVRSAVYQQQVSYVTARSLIYC